MRAFLVSHPFAHPTTSGMLESLQALGCTCFAVEGELTDEHLAQFGPVTIAIFDAGDRPDVMAQRCQRARAVPEFTRLPFILAVSAESLPKLSMSAPVDDIVVTPVLPAELYVRMRRLDWKYAAFQSDERLKLRGLVIDMAGHEVLCDGTPVSLTNQEYNLLCHLAKNRGRAYSRGHLIESVWGRDYEGGERTVDIHIRRLRAKLGKYAPMIVTVRGLGYKMALSSD